MAKQKAYKNLTIQEKMVMYLTDTRENGGRDGKVVDSRTGKYVVVVVHVGSTPHYFFLGKGGAIRGGSDNAATKSRDIASAMKKYLVDWEKRNQKEV